MVFVHQRIVHFQETDAAGVVYFANVLTFCHEAYEASLAATGIDLKTFFGGSDLAVPVVHASVDFWQPMYCGDRVSLHLTPTQRDRSRFEIQYQLYLPTSEKPISQALTRHVCIDATTRQRVELSAALTHWLTQWQNAPLPSPAAD